MASLDRSESAHQMLQVTSLLLGKICLDALPSSTSWMTAATHRVVTKGWLGQGETVHNSSTSLGTTVAEIYPSVLGRLGLPGPCWQGVGVPWLRHGARDTPLPAA